MSETTTIRISRVAHEELKQLAAERHATVSDTVARAIRLLRQEAAGQQLAAPLTADELAWLDADAG